MLIAALRDLQWRRRRFIIAVIGTGVVFAMTLILTGLSNGFDQEAADTVKATNVDAWIIPSGAAGPYLGASPFPETVAADVAHLDGVTKAAPLVFSGTTMREGGVPKNVNVFGAPADGPGMPAISDGRAPKAADEVAVSSKLSKGIGDRVELGADTLKVVGIVNDSTALAGTPNVFLTTAGRAEGVVRESAGRVVDRRDGQSHRRAAGIQGRHAGRRRRRHAPPDAVVALGDQLPRDPALDRRRADRRLGDLPLRARTRPRLRGVQGGRCRARGR